MQTASEAYVKRKEKVQRMREAGMSYQQIGDALKITRQRAHQIMHPLKKYFRKPQ